MQKLSPSNKTYRKLLSRSLLELQEDFLSIVKKQWLSKPHMASVGSCCLVGVICDGLLYIANAGDSRAVLGGAGRGTREAASVQLSTEDSVRDELRSMHPNDSQIVMHKYKVWLVKGIIQVSRSIRDAHLTMSEFNQEPLQSKFRLPEPFHKPILSPDPEILVRKLQPGDQILIFASDGLCEHLSNQEVVDIVQSFPRNGIARRLVKAALQEAAKKREMRHMDLKEIARGVRRHSHLISSPPLSIRGGSIPAVSNSVARF